MSGWWRPRLPSRVAKWCMRMPTLAGARSWAWRAPRCRLDGREDGHDAFHTRRRPSGRGAALLAAGLVGQSHPTRSLGLETPPDLCQHVHQDRASAVLLWPPRRAGLLTARTRAPVWGDLSERALSIHEASSVRAGDESACTDPTVHVDDRGGGTARPVGGKKCRHVGEFLYGRPLAQHGHAHEHVLGRRKGIIL